MNKLDTWINLNGGVGKTATKLGVTRRAVYNWKSRVTIPRIGHMDKIVKLSRGLLSHADLLNLTKPKN